MTIPSTTVTPRDGGLGLTRAVAGTHAKIGVCSSGTENSPVLIGSKQQAITELGYGPLTAAVQWHLERTGKPVLACKAGATTAGSCGAVTKNGSGPNITINTGTSYDSFLVIIEITKGGAVGTSEFRYSLDNGDTYIGPVVTAATVSLTNTGIIIACAAGTYVVGDTYTFTATEPRMAVADVQDAWAGLVGQNTYSFEFVHVLGGGSNAAATAALYSAVDTLAEAAATAGRFVWALVESSDDTTANIISAFAALSSKRILPCYGFAELQQPDKKIAARSIGWVIAARASALPISIDLASMADSENPESKLIGVVSITHDEGLDTGMNDAGWTTLRSFDDQTGFYVTNPALKPPAGSDFTLLQYRRIMDEACRTVKTALRRWQSARVPVDRTTGYIREKAARRIDAAVDAELQVALLEGGHASAATCRVRRDSNLLATQTLSAEVSVVPPGYAKTITADVSLVNPATLAT